MDEHIDETDNRFKSIYNRKIIMASYKKTIVDDTMGCINLAVISISTFIPTTSPKVDLLVKPCN